MGDHDSRHARAPPRGAVRLCGTCTSRVRACTPRLADHGRPAVRNRLAWLRPQGHVGREGGPPRVPQDGSSRPWGTRQSGRCRTPGRAFDPLAVPVPIALCIAHAACVLPAAGATAAEAAPRPPRQRPRRPRFDAIAHLWPQIVNLHVRGPPLITMRGSMPAISSASPQPLIPRSTAQPPLCLPPLPCWCLRLVACPPACPSLRGRLGGWASAPSSALTR